MQSAMMAKTPGLNNAIRNVLNGLHAQKTHAAVDAMLLRLYEPILFRALAATNSNVRRNAMLVLFDAFPLEVNRDDRALPSECACRAMPRSNLGHVCRNRRHQWIASIS